MVKAWYQREDRGPCRCGGCNKKFNRLSTFDAHRTGRFDNRRCLTTEEMEAKGWSLNANGRWVTEKSDRVHVGGGKWAAFSPTPVGREG